MGNIFDFFNIFFAFLFDFKVVLYYCMYIILNRYALLTAEKIK